MESRRLKSRSSTEVPIDPLAVQSFIASLRQELHTLGATIGKYRDFLLRHDSDPYVRTKGGFTEWIIGQEPQETKNMIDQGYEIQFCDQLCLQIYHAWGDRKEQPYGQTPPYREIDALLHEMAQPLASLSMIRFRATHLVDEMQKLDELSSEDPKITDFFTQTLSRAMRADWRYHTLFDIAAFHKIYDIHIGILGPIEDRAHHQRMRKFQALIAHIQKWVKEKTSMYHFQEIEADINDIKTYLQDFLAQLQRISKDASLFNKENREKIVAETAQQLLEYRYFFGLFFHSLHRSEDNEKLMRNQFLFVDQYFESLENKLQEMRSREG